MVENGDFWDRTLAVIVHAFGRINTESQSGQSDISHNVALCFFVSFCPPQNYCLLAIKSGMALFRRFFSFFKQFWFSKRSVWSSP